MSYDSDKNCQNVLNALKDYELNAADFIIKVIKSETAQNIHYKKIKSRV